MSDRVAAPRPENALSSAAAFFDVDGTLVSTHIVHQYLHVRKYLADHHGPWSRLTHPIWRALFYVKCLKYLYLDHVSRTRMNIAFYRNYGGLPTDPVHRAAIDCFDRVLKPHLFDEAIACVEEHVRAGRRIVLVTGSVDFLIRPLVERLASPIGAPAEIELIARSLTEHNGRFTGSLDGPPIGEHEKAVQITRYAERQGIDLAGSYAYGDSKADLPMLEVVGNPQVVNPDRVLADVARQRGWPTHTWRTARNGS